MFSFGDLEALAVLLGDLVHEWRDEAARTAPRRPEINEDGFIGFGDLRLEGRVCYLDRFMVIGW
jgi:hypothetical protein